ncbi:unnamed protein product, partial [Bubo scandiacus]
MAVPWQGFAPLGCAGGLRGELRGAARAFLGAQYLRGAVPPVPRRHSHFTNPCTRVTF